MKKTSIQIDVNSMPPEVRTYVIGLASRLNVSPSEAVVFMLSAATSRHAEVTALARRRGAAATPAAACAKIA